MPSENYGRLKLLFVDDAPHTLLMLREMLRNTNWSHAEFVDSATAAMAEIKANPPDLVFTDWQMPGQSGLELIRAIREMPGSPDPLLPVILLTANGDSDHVKTARKAGATDYLVKPISLNRIVERVTNVVTRQRPFIVASTYMGPDWRRVGQPGNGEGGGEDPLPPGAVVVPADGLLLAKVRGDRDALRTALLRRAEAIDLVRRSVREYRVRQRTAAPS
jgi:DNA-binding response OmpR family regulator